jgi:hypothetical protein
MTSDDLIKRLRWWSANEPERTECQEAAEALEAQAKRIAELEAEAVRLRTVMAAAAEEIDKHWAAHCDAEGYGPQNLMRRLEEGISVEYGYTAGLFTRQKARIEELEKALQSEKDEVFRLQCSHSALYARVQELEADARRYRWLRDNIKERPMNQRAYASEIVPDTRLRYDLPVLVSWADYCGQITLDDAVDKARAALKEKQP